jgi:predicted DNA-binding transcriptional regulator YafY
MNRTERQNALVAELRSVAPRPLSAQQLAERFQVSVRTLERDISILRRSGVPVWPVPGRRGEYALDAARQLAPVELTVAEAVTVSVALERLTDPELAEVARAALDKVRVAMPNVDVAAAHTIAERAQLVPPAPGEGGAVAKLPSVPMVLQEALAAERVVAIEYADAAGAVTRRTVEPIGFVGSRRSWHLLAWCRLRHGVRGFRLDRIRSARIGTEQVTAHRNLPALDLPEQVTRTLAAG